MTRPMDPESLRRIERAVVAAEAATAGEIVVVIAPRSGRWAGPRALFASVVMTFGVLALSYLFQPHAGWVALAAPVAFTIGWWIACIGAVTRVLAGSAALDAGVARAAKVAFVDHGVHATRTRAGVLIYVSLLEHRAHVLGDSAVHGVIGELGWHTWADRVGGAMRKRDVDALVAVVRDVGATLARSFPRAAGDENELADAVRVANG